MAYFDHFKELAVELNTTGSEKLDTYLLRMLTSDVALPMSASGKEDLPLHKVDFLHTSIIVLTLHNGMQLVELILFSSKTASKVFGETHEVVLQIHFLRVNFNSTLTLTLTLTLTRI